jgi:signal transduction histidine kinase
MIRLILAMLGALVALVGHDLHTPAAVAVGLAAVLPLLVKMLTLPAAGRAGFVLTAVVAGLVLAGYAAGHHGAAVDRHRPVPAACGVAEVHR